MLDLIIVIVLLMWLLGYFVINVGSLIHLLLVVALVMFIMRLIRGRPTTI